MINNRWEYGKSLHKFIYTYQDIAKATRLSINTIRRYACQGKLDPNSLESVSRFIAKYQKTNC